MLENNTYAETKKIFYIVNVDWFFLSHRLELARASKKLGYEVYILTKNTGKKEVVESHDLHFIDIDFERSGKNPLKEVKVIIDIFKYIRLHNPSIIHNVTIKSALYGSLAAKLYRRPSLKIVNAISGLGYNFIGDRQGPIQKVLKRLMNLAFKRNVNFIFQNPDDLGLYRELGYLNENKYKLIKGAGVNSTEFPYSLPIEKEKLHVVFIARMLKDKGVIEFAEAATILQEKWGSKAIFRLIGDVDSSNPAGLKESEIRALEIPQYIVWEGHSSDVKPILVDSDIVCLPSYREGLPKSLIEAMAIGRPIVTTDVPGCRECVEEKYNGYLVPSRNSKDLAEAVDALLTDSELRLKMGKHSRLKMEKELSLEKVINDTLAFYKEVQA